MDGFQDWAGVVVTLLPDKGDRDSGPCLSYHRATFQGAENAGKLEPEASVAPTPHCASQVHAEVDRKVVGSNPGRNWSEASMEFFTFLQFSR